MPGLCYVGGDTQGLCMLSGALYWLRHVPSLEALFVRDLCLAFEIISPGLPSLQLSFIYKYLLKISLLLARRRPWGGSNATVECVSKAGACKYPKARVVAKCHIRTALSCASLSLCGPSHALHLRWGFSHAALFISLFWQPYCHGLEHSTLTCKVFPSHYSLH